MTRLYLVRHGEAAAGWTEDPDPGLSIRGRDQARELADAMVAIGARPVLTSPKRRARETAEALASRWGFSPETVPALGEIPTPEDVAPEERGGWLRDLTERRWDEVTDELRAWRDGVMAALADLRTDAVVVSHFMAINAAVSGAEGAERLVSFRPGYCSVTVIERDGPSLRVVERGAEARTVVL